MDGMSLTSVTTSSSVHAGLATPLISFALEPIARLAGELRGIYANPPPSRLLDPPQPVSPFAASLIF